MKLQTFIFSILLLFSAFAQAPYDTVIDRGSYKSYYNRKYQIPVFVTFKLWHASDSCNRDTMGFQVDTNTYIAANINRAILGYDRGHLAGIQDFADSCALTNSTFKYYDAVPLTPNLNRIIWKLDESLNRQESQSDSLWIIAGISYQDCILTYYYSDIRILLPRHYWRVVQSLSNNAILHCTIYDNTKQTRKTETDITNIQRLLGCQIPLQGTPTMPVKTKKIPVPQAMQVDSTKTAPTKRPVHHPVNTSPVEIKGNGAATAPPPTPMIKPPDVSSTPPIN